MWLAAVLAVLLGMLNAALLARLASLFSGRSVMGFLDGIGSTITAKAVGFLFVAFTVTVASLTLRDFAELMVMDFMPGTPVPVFILIMAVLITWAVYLGLEVIARMAQFLLPLTLTAIVLSSVMSFNNPGTHSFLPLVENGLAPIIHGGLTQWAFFGDVAIWFLLLPYLNKQENSYTFMPLSILFAGALLILVLLSIINGLGAPSASLQTTPFVSLIETVSLGGFIEGFESVFLIVWISANFMKAAVFFCTAVSGTNYFFQRKKTIYVIFPLMVVTVFLSIFLFHDYQQLRQFFRPESYAVYAAVFQVVIPVIVLGCWSIRTRFGRIKQGG